MGRGAAFPCFGRSPTARLRTGSATSFWKPTRHRSPPASRRKGQLREHRQKLTVFLVTFRGKGPFFAQPLIELGAEEGVLHAAVDDVPGQDDVGRPVAENVE